jgi:hypothetical protein
MDFVLMREINVINCGYSIDGIISVLPANNDCCEYLCLSRKQELNSVRITSDLKELREEWKYLKLENATICLAH